MFIFNIYIYLTNNFKDNYISFYSQIDCSASSSVLDLSPDYRKSAGLRYPVNVGRNVARQSANTHFVFPSDVELYPTPGKRVFQCSFFYVHLFPHTIFLPFDCGTIKREKINHDTLLKSLFHFFFIQILGSERIINIATIFKRSYI